MYVYVWLNVIGSSYVIGRISWPCMILGLWFMLGKLGIFMLKHAYGECIVY